MNYSFMPANNLNSYLGSQNFNPYNIYRLSYLLFENDFDGNRICVFRVILFVEMHENKCGVDFHTHDILGAVFHIPSFVYVLHQFLKEAVVNLCSLFKCHIFYCFFMQR